MTFGIGLVTNRKYLLGGGRVEAICTGIIHEVDNKRYHEFVSATIAPDWFRLHYVEEQGIAVQGKFVRFNEDNYNTRIVYRPDVLETLIVNAMRKQFQQFENKKEKNTH